jgi:O-antigen/teichoic acid export membrane protein
MSFGRRILFGGAISWFARGTNVLLGLVLLPVLFRNLPKEELGVWMLLAQSWASLGILDLGFGVVLTRRIAFAVGKRINVVDEEGSARNANEVGQLLATGSRIYHWLAVFAFTLSFCCGAFYLPGLKPCGVPQALIWTAWGTLCLSQAAGVWVTVWTCVLQGAGYVGWDGLLGSLVNSLTLVIQIIAVLLGGGLVALATIAAIGTLTQRWLVAGFIHRLHPEFFKSRGVWNPALFRSMLPPASRTLLTTLGYLLIANTDQFFISARQGAVAIPAYRAAFLLVINLHLLAGVFSAASPVFISQLWQAGKMTEIRAILCRNARMGLLAMGCGGAAILALGGTLFEVWLGANNFVGYPVLGIFLATFVLEHHANVFSTCGRATNDEAYAASSIAGGILKLVLAFFLTSRLGLAGLALSTLVAQGLTNDWFMVHRSARRLGVNFIKHCREVLLPVALVWVAAFAVAFITNRALREHGPELRMVMVSAAAVAVLGLSLWRLVLEESQRDWLKRRFGVG